MAGGEKGRLEIIVDNNSPEVSNYGGYGSHYYIQDQLTNITLNITDYLAGVNISLITIYNITHPNLVENETLNINSEGLYYYELDPTTLADGNYSTQIFVNDSISNYNFVDGPTIFIDNIKPSLVNASVSLDTLESGDVFDILLNLSDDCPGSGLYNITLIVNASGFGEIRRNYSISEFSEENIFYNESIILWNTLNYPADTYDIYVIIYDRALNSNSTYATSFTIEDFTPPVINSLEVDNLYTQNGTNVTIIANVKDPDYDLSETNISVYAYIINTSDDSLIYSLELVKNSEEFFVGNLSTDTFIGGKYIINLTAIDAASNYGYNNSSIYFYIDDRAPEIDVSGFENQDFYANAGEKITFSDISIKDYLDDSETLLPLYNYSLILNNTPEELHTIDLEYDSSSGNYTKQWIVEDIGVGKFNITVLAFDMSGRSSIYYTNAILEIADDVPIINSIEVDNTIQSDDKLIISVDAYDAGSGIKNISIKLDNILLDYYEDVNSIDKEISIYEFSFSEGIYTLNVNVEDYGGNSVSDTSISIIIDDSNPEYRNSFKMLGNLMEDDTEIIAESGSPIVFSLKSYDELSGIFADGEGGSYIEIVDKNDNIQTKVYLSTQNVDDDIYSLVSTWIPASTMEGTYYVNLVLCDNSGNKEYVDDIGTIILRATESEDSGDPSDGDGSGSSSEDDSQSTLDGEKLAPNLLTPDELWNQLVANSGDQESTLAIISSSSTEGQTEGTSDDREILIEEFWLNL